MEQNSELMQYCIGWYSEWDIVEVLVCVQDHDGCSLIYYPETHYYIVGAVCLYKLDYFYRNTTWEIIVINNKKRNHIKYMYWTLHDDFKLSNSYIIEDRKIDLVNQTTQPREEIPFIFPT